MSVLIINVCLSKLKEGFENCILKKVCGFCAASIRIKCSSHFHLWRVRFGSCQTCLKSKKVSNDQELVQSEPTKSCSQNQNWKESLLLRRGISLKVIYEIVKISNCDFCNNFHDYKETNM